MQCCRNNISYLVCHLIKILHSESTSLLLFLSIFVLVHLSRLGVL